MVPRCLPSKRNVPAAQRNIFFCILIYFYLHVWFLTFFIGTLKSIASLFAQCKLRDSPDIILISHFAQLYCIAHHHLFNSNKKEKEDHVDDALTSFEFYNRQIHTK